MNCNTEIHDEMITMEYIDCPFCEQHVQQSQTIYYLPCCNKEDDSYISIASEYVDF